MYEPVYARKRNRRRSSDPVGVVSGVILTVVLVFLGVWMLTDPAFALVLGEPEETTVTTLSPRDTQPPRIQGTRDFLVYQGDTIGYLEGVSAVDDMDADPQLLADSDQVDLSRPGVYTVTYEAADDAGNICTVDVTVTVLEKKAGYADLESIYTLADDLLVLILENADTVQQQVEAIYRWARSDIRYAGHSDRTDWRQTAYTVIRTGEGDCFGFFAATKLMFERLGIPNIDVQKVRNSDDDSDHFWSLVSIDGGENYYHFDATPRYGSGDNFCLVTDAFLNAYSEDNKGSHNRDTSAYPATPEESL